ncbi:MAG: ABC transporter permease subunit [Planctomycetes bacterium]|nr:ABC transporter permease subunit [Planctomycetota bacterium]
MTAILAREIGESLRSRWFLLVTGVFCTLALGVSYLSWSGADALGFAGFSRTVASLLNLMLLFVPLLALLVGALGISGEREDGTLGYVLAQPIGRGAVYLGKLLGQGASLGGAVALGLGLVGLVIGRQAGAEGAGAFAVLAVDALLLGAASLAIGVFVSVCAGSRLAALVFALVLWVLFAFVLDFVTVGLVIAGWTNPGGLFLASLANPVACAKVLCLLALNSKLEVLGPAGIHAVKTFGSAGAAALLAGALCAWTVLPAWIGWRRFRRMDVR